MHDASAPQPVDANSGVTRAIARPDSSSTLDYHSLSSESSQDGATESRTLWKDIENHICQAERSIVSHVESFGCTDLTLRLSILDLRTRYLELELLSRVDGVDSSALGKLEDMVHRARDDVVRYVKLKHDRSKDVELRIGVLDLETRVIERRKMLEASMAAP